MGRDMVWLCGCAVQVPSGSRIHPPDADAGQRGPGHADVLRRPHPGHQDVGHRRRLRLCRSRWAFFSVAQWWSVSAADRLHVLLYRRRSEDQEAEGPALGPTSVIGRDSSMVWYGMVWYGTVWYGYGVVWNDMASIWPIFVWFCTVSLALSVL